MECYVPNNPQFGECCTSCCDPLQPCACLHLHCCQQENEPCCQDNGTSLNTLAESIEDCVREASEVTDNWSEDMGSFSLPTLDLDPLPSLLSFSPCSQYNRGNGGDYRERGGGDAADVLLSLKHAVVHGDCATETHPQMMVNGGGGYPYYEHYGGAPLFPTMSVNVSMNMTMHGCPPDQLCPQVQWNQNAPPPAVNVVYPQPQNVMNPSTYPSATYSFTADFRPTNQSDPLITANASTFKQLQLQNSQKTPPSYNFQQKPNFGQKNLSIGSLKRSPSKMFEQKEQAVNGYTILNHQPQIHPQEYHGYGGCGNSVGKVQVGALSGCSEDDEQKPNLCRICGKTYARPSTLKTHLRTHSGERPYRCGDCNKSFSQAANLTAHVRTHTGQKPFRCPICDRRFSQSSSVTTHMRTHSGERPYQCRSCKKAFSDSSTLTKHLRIHSGEKPYQCKLCLLRCPICDRRFSQSSSVTTHMRTHSGERPYQCRSCKKAFSDSSTLTKHLRIHSGEKPYQCKLCLLRFSQSGNLSRHMRVHGNMSGSVLG